MALILCGVCCRIFHAELPHVTIQAIDIAAVLAHLPHSRARNEGGI